MRTKSAATGDVTVKTTAMVEKRSPKLANMFDRFDDLSLRWDENLEELARSIRTGREEGIRVMREK